MARKTSIPIGGRLKRNLITLGLALLILYIGAHAISRTEGVRTVVADKISNALKQPVALEKCSATPLLGLRLEGLSFQGVEMPDVKTSLDWFAWISKKRPLVKRLVIEDLDVRFRRIPGSGNWDPLILQGVGFRLGAILGLNPGIAKTDPALPKFPEYVINKKTLLQLHRADIVWNDERGLELASISDTDFSMKTGRFTGRKVIQTLAECRRVKLASGRTLDDFRLETFEVEGSDIVTVLDMSDSGGEYEAFATTTLWQDLGLHLNALSNL